MKIIYYVPVKVMINAPSLVKMIINVVVHYHKVPKSIVTDWGLLFIFKFWFLLCYFLEIKQKLSTAFYPQTNDQTEKQNSTIETYLKVFVNWKQDDWARLLLIVEFAYNNAKNASTDHTSFELHCGYHPRVFFKKDIDPHLKSRSTNKLAEELREMMEIYCQNLLHR